MVLCYLEGRTYEEAAQLLRCPVGTIKSRLATARDRLRRRLERLELAPAVGTAALSPQLVDATIREVVGNSSGGFAATAVARLARGVLRIMFLERLGAVGGALLACAVLATVAIDLAWAVQGPAAEVAVEAPAAVPRAAPANPPPRLQAAAPREIPTSVTGRVVDEQGRPVAGAEVRLRLFRTAVRLLRIAAEVVDAWEVRTDADGRYRVEGVRFHQGGDYEQLAMDVNAPDHVEYTNRQISDLPHATARKGNLPDVPLRRGVAVTGRCVGPDGKPVAGAKIQAAFAQEPISGQGRTRTTGADGRFRLNIPDGRDAELIVYPPSLAPRWVEVAAGGGELGDIRLEAGVELIGRLGEKANEIFEGQGPAKGLTATASMPGGRPLAGKVIAPREHRSRPVQRVPDQAGVSDRPRGEFPRPGPEGFLQDLDRPGPRRRAGRPRAGRRPGSVPAVRPMVLNFDPRSVGARRVLLLSPAPEIAIRGRITGPDGMPAGGVCLWLLVGWEDDNRLTPIRWAATDAEGRYALTGLPRVDAGLSRYVRRAAGQPLVLSLGRLGPLPGPG